VATHIQEDEPKATFIFKGTIRKLNAATMPDVPVTKSTAVVRIDQVVSGPSDLSAFLGQEITVEVSNKQSRVGQKLIFHAVPWMFGAGIAVRSIREESAGNVRAQTPTGAYDDADLVVRGKVVRVQLPKKVTRTQTKSATLPITEHAPLWREAIIEVEQVLKGKEKARHVTVCFPDSSDVMFRGVPKFEPGQQGYFILHKDAPTPFHALPEKTSAAGQGRDEQRQMYFVIDPQDFQPLEK